MVITIFCGPSAPFPGDLIRVRLIASPAPVVIPERRLRRIRDLFGRFDWGKIPDSQAASGMTAANYSAGSGITMWHIAAAAAFFASRPR